MIYNFKSALLGFVFLLVVFGTASCLKSRRPGIPLEVVHVIQTTGVNRVELTKSIANYIQEPDSIKRNALYFLIKNMERHYAVEYEIKDSNDTIYHIDPLNFANDSLLFAYWDSLSNHQKGFGYHAKRYVLDRDTITSELLIQTIESAFLQKRQPYLAYVPDDVFLQYVIPYRIGNEQIEDWRHGLKHLADSIVNSMKMPQADSLAMAVNEYVNTHFSFDKRFLKNADEMLNKDLFLLRRGNDRDLSWLKVKLLRTMGIPATIDYIPYLADSSHSFHFAVYFATDSTFKPLLNLQENVLLTNSRRIPKVYRRVYHQLDSSLFALKDIRKTTPPYLGHYHYLDVTNNYINTVKQIYHGPCPDSIIYITVFNDGEWRAVDWAKCTQNTAVFSNFGGINSFGFGYLDNETKEFELIQPGE